MKNGLAVRQFMGKDLNDRKEDIMKITEATANRIQSLCKQNNITLYELSYRAAMPPSTLKCILNGKSQNPGIANLARIAEGFGMSIREFYDSDLFSKVEPES